MSLKGGEHGICKAIIEGDYILGGVDGRVSFLTGDDI